MIRRPPKSTLFPNPTLFRSVLMEGARRIDEWSRIEGRIPHLGVVPMLAPPSAGNEGELDLDRKSTRLNSSHLVISYAVFCLKKKKLHTPVHQPGHGIRHEAV